jgi:hypothetical protein
MDTETCSVCHRDGVKIYARGLCRTHYLVDLKQRREDGDEVADKNTGTSSDVLGQADDVSTVLVDFPATRSAESPPMSSPYVEERSSTVETRPGEVGTPSSPRVASGPEVTPTAPEGKLRGLFKKKPKTPSSPTVVPTTTKEKRPGARTGRRVSAADTIADGWAALGGVAIRTGTHAPLGRCLQWQAPMAGEMLDEVVAGTIVDKIALQKVAKGRHKFDVLGAVIGPPLLVMAIERNPQNAPSLMPLLASSIRHSLPHMVPAIKKAKAKEAKIAEATAELFADDPDFREGDDPVAYILGMMFEGWVPPTPPEPQEVPDIYEEPSVA